MKTNSQALQNKEMKKDKNNLKKNITKIQKNKRQKRRRKKPNIVDYYFD